MIDDFSYKYIQEFIKSIHDLKISDVNPISRQIWKAYLSEKQIFVMGNGGSASIASHFACDLGKSTAIDGKPRFRVQSLNDNVPLMTALANDLGYENLFSEQMRNLARKEDVVIAISSAGNSENIYRAIKFANEIDAISVAITGFGGGRVNKIAQYNLILDSYDYGVVETIHMFVCHSLAFAFKDRLEKTIVLSN